MARSPAGARRARAGHLPQVDGLRALAALYVLFTHAVLVAMPGRDGSRPGWLVPGHFAVAVFIVVSGLCLSLPLVRTNGELRGGALRFYVRRARRILPPYYATLLLTLVLCWTALSAETGTFWDFTVPITAAGYVGTLLLAQDVVGFWQISVPFWSIAVEFQIYLLFPLLLWCWRRYGAGRTVLSAVWLAYPAVSLTDALGKRGPAYFPGLSLQFIGFFTLGMAGAWLAFSEDATWVRARERVPWGRVTGLGAATAVGLTYLAGRLADWLTSVLELPVALATAGVLVVASRQGRTRLTRALGLRPLAFVGTFSYSLYLVQAPLLQAEWQYGLRPLHLGRGANLALLSGIGIALLLGAAYLFHLAFERPFLAARRTATTTRPQPSAVTARAA